MAIELMSKKIIWTSAAIAKYIGVSRGKFYSLVKHGLPAVVIDGTWCAHADNLEAFFQKCTCQSMQSIPPEAEEGLEGGSHDKPGPGIPAHNQQGRK